VVLCVLATEPLTVALATATELGEKGDQCSFFDWGMCQVTLPTAWLPSSFELQKLSVSFRYGARERPAGPRTPRLTMLSQHAYSLAAGGYGS